MGTTLVALAVEERHVWVLNIGDSRCYRLRNGRLEQLTLDHSLVEEQVRMGRMSHSEALRSPLKNVITRALGTQVRVTPDVFGLEAEPGDLFLLCSDGLTRELSDPVIESLLSSGLRLKTSVLPWSMPPRRPAATTTLPACWCAQKLEGLPAGFEPQALVLKFINLCKLQTSAIQPRNF